MIPRAVAGRCHHGAPEMPHGFSQGLDHVLLRRAVAGESVNQLWYESGNHLISELLVNQVINSFE